MGNPLQQVPHRHTIGVLLLLAVPCAVVTGFTTCRVVVSMHPQKATPNAVISDAEAAGFWIGLVAAIVVLGICFGVGFFVGSARNR